MDECDLCGGRERGLLHRWPVGDPWNPATVPLHIWQCLGCGLAFLDPVPTAEQLPDAGDWWSPKRRHLSRHYGFKVRWERIRYALFGHARDRLLRATRKAVPEGRLLDVGCGQGDLLASARKFYECVGLEPSPVAAEAVRRLGFPVVQSTLEEADLGSSAFDVVVLDGVIEHVRSPIRALRKINTVLRPNGVVVLKTPKFGGPTYRHCRGGWNGFRHGYHTFLFSGQTLGKCLEKSGFQVLRRPRRDRVLDDILVLWGRKTRQSA